MRILYIIDVLGFVSKIFLNLWIIVFFLFLDWIFKWLGMMILLIIRRNLGMNLIFSLLLFIKVILRVYKVLGFMFCLINEMKCFILCVKIVRNKVMNIYIMCI